MHLILTNSRNGSKSSEVLGYPCEEAMIQSRISKIDFDFYTYGNGRFDRLRKNIEDADFNRRLEHV